MAAPAEENELQHLVKTAFDANCPFMIRYPRGSGLGVKMDDTLKALPIGKGVWLEKGKNLTILAIGKTVHIGLETAKILADKGVKAGVINMRFLKPLDTKIIKEALKTSPNIVTLEDNVLAGGFGSAVAEFVADENLDSNLLRLGIPDEFIEHGTQKELFEQIGMTAPKIAAKIQKHFKLK